MLLTMSAGCHAPVATSSSSPGSSIPILTSRNQSTAGFTHTKVVREALLRLLRSFGSSQRVPYQHPGGTGRGTGCFRVC